MCGRYRRRSDKQKIAEAFKVRISIDELNFAPEEDITPGTMQPVVLVNKDGQRDMELMYWGFYFPQRFTFNTRSDSVLKSGLWKSSFEDRRCIIPADSYFEWKRIRKTNNPKYEVTVPGRYPFGFAGIWSMWTNKVGQHLPTMSIITTEPNEKVAEFHDRQPVILEPHDYGEWLTPAERPPLHLLRITPPEEMNITPVQEGNLELPL